MAQPIGSNFIQCGNDPSDPNTYRRILAQYIDASIAPPTPVTPDLSSVLAVGNSTGGLSIDASGIGGTAIDATGSDVLAQNLNVEKITPLGAPIVTNVTLDGGLTLQTGGSYRVEFEDEIRIGKGVTDFIYTDPTDGLHLENAPEVFVDTLHYNTLDPAPPAPINYQTFYANLGDDLQTALIPLASGTRKALQLSTGSWSYGGTLNFGGDTCAVVGQPSFSPLTRITASGGFLLDGASSTRYQFRNIAFNGLFQIDGTQGRHRFYDCEFLSSVLFTGTTTNFLTFENCEFSSGSLTIPITFGGVIFFKNCNFTGITAINLNQPMATQVVFLGCIGVSPVNPAKCTIQAWNEINGSSRADAVDVNCVNLNSKFGTITDAGGATILIDPNTVKGIEIQEATGAGKIKISDADGDEVEIQNTEIDVFHSATLNQTDRYYQFKDASGNQVDWYMGSTVPTHPATNGSLFVLAGASPSIYQYGSSGWASVGGGGSSVVGSYNVPCIVKSTFPTNQSITTSPSVLLFDTNTIDTPASWIGTPSSGVWTIPFNGTYTITALIQITTSVNDSCRVVVYVNGTASGARDIEYTPTGSNTIALSYTDTFSYGDLIDLRGSNTTGTATYLASGSYATIQAFRQDPLTISSTIYIPKICKYEASSTQALSSTPNQLLFYNNPDIKTPNNSWITDTAGEFTIVENGVYRIFVSLYFASLASDRTIGILIYKNGSTIAEDKEFSPSSQSNPIVTCEATESLIAGDIIQPWGYASVASTATINVSCYWLIEKITV